MKIVKFNSKIEGFYKPWAKVQAIELPDGKYFLPKDLIEQDDVLSDQTLASQIQSEQDSETDLEYLPEMGEQCTEGVVYKIPNPPEGLSDLVICRQTHTRTEHDVQDIPALFTFFRENADDLQWILNELVESGWKRVYEGIVYTCLQGHMTQSDWTPDSTPTLWAAEASETGEWQAGTAYSIGDVVTYNGNEYECIQAHTAIAGWYPDVVPALWRAL